MRKRLILFLKTCQATFVLVPKGKTILLFWCLEKHTGYRSKWEFLFTTTTPGPSVTMPIHRVGSQQKIVQKGIKSFRDYLLSGLFAVWLHVSLFRPRNGAVTLDIIFKKIELFLVSHPIYSFIKFFESYSYSWESQNRFPSSWCSC